MWIWSKNRKVYNYCVVLTCKLSWAWVALYLEYQHHQPPLKSQGSKIWICSINKNVYNALGDYVRIATFFNDGWKSMSNFFQCWMIRPTAHQRNYRTTSIFERVYPIFFSVHGKDQLVLSKNYETTSIFKSISRTNKTTRYLTTKLRAEIYDNVDFLTMVFRKTTELQAFLKENVRFFSVLNE